MSAKRPVAPLRTTVLPFGFEMNCLLARQTLCGDELGADKRNMECSAAVFRDSREGSGLPFRNKEIETLIAAAKELAAYSAISVIHDCDIAAHRFRSCDC